MYERSRFDATIRYQDGTFKTVPIINGYAPQVTTSCCWDGSERRTYDYRGRIFFRPEWQLGWKESSRELPKAPTPSLAPRKLVPLPRPVPLEEDLLPKAPSEEPKVEPPKIEPQPEAEPPMSEAPSPLTDPEELRIPEEYLSFPNAPRTPPPGEPRRRIVPHYRGP